MEGNNEVHQVEDSSKTAEIVKATHKTSMAGFHVIQESLDRVDKSIGDLTKSIQSLSTAPLNPFAPPPDLVPQRPSSSASSRASADDDQPRIGQNQDGGAKDTMPEAILPTPIRIIAKVRTCDWQHFKNRFSEEDACYAIEILEDNFSLTTHMAAEISKRTIEGIYVPPPPAPGRPKSVASDYLPPPPIPRHSGMAPAPLPPPPPPPQPGQYLSKHYKDDPWIHRVRINSRAVMELLGSCSKEGRAWKGEPRTFVRPFRYLLFFHDKMKRKVEEITKGTMKETPTDNEDDTSSEEEGASSFGEQVLETRPKSRPRYDFSDKESQEELHCYIKFVDERLVPPSRRFDNLDLSKSQTIRFHELDYLFKIGQYIYFEKSHFVKAIPTQQKIKRLHDVESSRLCHCSTYECEHRKLPLTLRCHYLDHDGGRYGSLVSDLTPWSWEGEMKITDMEYFPLEYLPENGQAELNQAKHDGTNFVNHLTKRYSFYSGWSLTKGPDLRMIEDPKTSEAMKNPEHIESDVLVDLTETFDSIPSWRPYLVYSGPRPPSVNAVLDKVDTQLIINWSNNSRTTVKNSWTELIYDDAWIYEREAIKFLDENPVLCLTMNNRPIPTPSGNELALLPRRMFAYAVWDRKFLPIDSRYLKRTERHGEEGEAFEQLQILDENKRLITALLQSHFRKKQLEAQGIEVPTQDLIRGKGRGIVILLHGVPGVGKTATAEAVAQKWKRPLFPITCGDLGFTPEKVEASLKEIFRLAHLWDCVLLLDEADVFIAQREKTGADLQRNALVSVFLRMLEYYNGVLFLTTNRVGVLDEAIKSRVHLHLKYNHLNKSQTVEIFKHNIKRLRAIEQQRDDNSRLTIAENEILDFARKHYDQHSNGSGIGMWNGRQIRNAFLIAASLAHHDGDLERESDPAMQKQLRASHFDLVDKATVSYDQDRAETLGHTDSERAYDRQERNDPRSGQAGHGGAPFGYSAPPAPVQPPHYAGGQYASPPGSFQGTGQSTYPLQAQQQMYAAGPQSYGGIMSEPRFPATTNESRTDTAFTNSGQQGYGPGSAQPGDGRGGAAQWQPPSDGQWR